MILGKESVDEKINSEFKVAILCLKIDLVSHPARDRRIGLIHSVIKTSIMLFFFIFIYHQMKVSMKKIGKTKRCCLPLNSSFTEINTG